MSMKTQKFLVKYYGYDDELVGASFVYGIGTNEARWHANRKCPEGTMYFILKGVQNEK